MERNSCSHFIRNGGTFIHLSTGKENMEIPWRAYPRRYFIPILSKRRHGPDY